MTNKKEYVVTLDDVCEGCGHCKRDGDYEKECCILRNVRSRLLSHEIKDARISERDKVLKGILVAMNDPQMAICDTGYLEHSYWVEYIKSLRGVTK